MMGTTPSHEDQPLFSYHVHLERRLRPDHPLRQLHAALDLSFVLPTVRPLYGRSGHVSLDPRVIMKMMLLLFYYNIPSERELMDQIGERLDFLWFLGFDLETPIPDHSVLSKARARWGVQVFEALFVRTVQQCVGAGLVDGRLLHVDSTIVKANASKNSVLQSSPEMVSALRQAYQEQSAKLEVLSPSEPRAAADLTAQKPDGKKLSVNQTHISLSDPQAQIARCKNGVTDLTYKEHRAVDDSRGVITAVETTVSTVADGVLLPTLVQQHQNQTGIESASLTLAGDGHYGTADNYLYCLEQNLRPHLAQVSAHLQERGLMPASRFLYEAQDDRYLCPQGHYLKLHQYKSAEKSKVYLIQEAALCAACPLRSQCTTAKAGRSLKRHIQADILARAQQEAQSPAARYSRKRRKHVMEGSFADAANNHGSKRARWRGLARQRLQSWLICAVQNLRLFIKHRRRLTFPGAGAGSVVEIFSRTAQQRPILVNRSAAMPFF
jgi:transposase